MIEDIKVEKINEDGTKTKVNGSNTGRHDILCAFNVIIDLDFAVLRMIQAEYNNPQYVDQKIMRATSKKVKYALVNRKDENPVTICIHDKKLADRIYSEIMSTRYKDLIGKYYCNTGLFLLMSTYYNVKDTSVTILCQSEEEVNAIRKYDKKIETLVAKDFKKDVVIDDYTDFFFKNKNDVFLFDQEFYNKRVVFMNYRFNVFIDKKPFPDLRVSNYLYKTYTMAAICDIYNKNDEDYATLKVAFKKKPKNN